MKSTGAGRSKTPKFRQGHLNLGWFLTKWWTEKSQNSRAIPHAVELRVDGVHDQLRRVAVEEDEVDLRKFAYSMETKKESIHAEYSPEAPCIARTGRLWWCGTGIGFRERRGVFPDV